VLVSRGHPDAYLVDGSCATLGEERVLELIRESSNLYFFLALKLWSLEVLY